jgi:HEAT repeat protein
MHLSVTRFLVQCEALRTWAGVLPAGQGEWEMDYPGWDELYSATRDLLSNSPSSLPAPVTSSLLYVLARDNEAEHVKELLEAVPEVLVALAANAADAERDARWQLADALKTVNTQHSMDLLKGLSTDGDEYVRRRALLAMATLDAERLRRDEGSR